MPADPRDPAESAPRCGACPNRPDFDPVHDDGLCADCRTEHRVGVLLGSCALPVQALLRGYLRALHTVRALRLLVTAKQASDRARDRVGLLLCAYFATALRKDHEACARILADAEYDVLCAGSPEPPRSDEDVDAIALEHGEESQLDIAVGL